MDRTLIMKSDFDQTVQTAQGVECQLSMIACMEKSQFYSSNI